MIGLGVGIDYALFIVTRYRQGLNEGRDAREATVVALITAGPGRVVRRRHGVISLLGLFVVGLPFMDGLAVGAIAAVLMVLAAALTLLPAMLGFVGRAIDRLHVPGLLVRAPTSGRGFWYRWSRTVQRRPWICGTSGAAGAGGAGPAVVLHAAGLQRRRQRPDQADDPPGLRPAGRRLRARLQRTARHRRRRARPDRPCRRPGRRREALEPGWPSVPGVASVAGPVFNAAGDAAVIIAYPDHRPAGGPDRLAGPAPAQRRHPARGSKAAGVTVLVGGVTAGRRRRLPLPVQAVAAGDRAGDPAVVLAADDGVPVHRHPDQGRRHEPAVDGGGLRRDRGGVPVGLAGVVVRGEPDWSHRPVDSAHDVHHRVRAVDGLRGVPAVADPGGVARRGVNTVAVADGLASTARVITAAAAIMVCVFGSFVINDPLRVLDVFGLGLAVAVFVDATLVRMVLVPSVMQLLGRANWWMPAWLDRLLPRLAVEAEVPPVVAHGPVEGEEVVVH